MEVRFLKRFNNFLNNRSVFTIEIWAYASVLIIGYLDYLTGREFFFSIFYFLPILFYAWHGSGRISRNIMLSVVAAVAWFVADRSAGYHYVHPLIPYWNAVMRLAIFVTVFLLLSVIREERARMLEQNLKLQSLNDQKNQFLGMAAHDLRTPISIIQFYSSILLEGSGERISDEHRDFIVRIEKTSKFMLELLDDLLDLSKIESGKLELELSEKDYGDFIRRSVDLHKIVAGAKKISLNLSIQDGLPPICFDDSKVEQVMSNLISNAVKYSAPGTSIDIRVEGENHYIITRVIDHGQGIPADELPLLFQPFAKTSAKSTGGEKSTGLGLAIAKKIVESHKGEIGAESELGQGSTFYFKLPFTEMGSWGSDLHS